MQIKKVLKALKYSIVETLKSSYVSLDSQSIPQILFIARKMFMILNLRNHYQLSIVLEFLFLNLHIIKRNCIASREIKYYFISRRQALIFC